jgi:hypothetical protein
MWSSSLFSFAMLFHRSLRQFTELPRTLIYLCVFAPLREIFLRLVDNRNALARPALYCLPSETRAGMTKDRRSSRSASTELGDKEHRHCKHPAKSFAPFTIGLASEAALQGRRAIASLRSALVCADRSRTCCCRRKESMDQEELPGPPRTSNP